MGRAESPARPGRSSKGERIMEKITLELTREQAELIKELVWIAIKNGNSVNKTAYATNPTGYKLACQIANKLM
jgi:hypothetical protein